jgi:hypothetical protein
MRQSITAKEYDTVLAMLDAGMSRRQIAARLGMNRRTVNRIVDGEKPRRDGRRSLQFREPDTTIGRCVCHGHYGEIDALKRCRLTRWQQRADAPPEPGSRGSDSEPSPEQQAEYRARAQAIRDAGLRELGILRENES